MLMHCMSASQLKFVRLTRVLRDGITVMYKPIRTSSALVKESCVFRPEEAASVSSLYGSASTCKNSFRLPLGFCTENNQGLDSRSFVLLGYQHEKRILALTRPSPHPKLLLLVLKKSLRFRKGLGLLPFLGFPCCRRPLTKHGLFFCRCGEGFQIRF